MTKKSATVLRNVSHGVNDIFWFILPSLHSVIFVQFDMKYGTAGGLVAAFLVTIAEFSFAERYGVFIAFLLLSGIGVGSYPTTIYAHIDETMARRQGREYLMFEF